MEEALLHKNYKRRKLQAARKRPRHRKMSTDEDDVDGSSSAAAAAENVIQAIPAGRRYFLSPFADTFCVFTTVCRVTRHLMWNDDCSGSRRLSSPAIMAMTPMSSDPVSKNMTDVVSVYPC